MGLRVVVGGGVDGRKAVIDLEISLFCVRSISYVPDP